MKKSLRRELARARSLSSSRWLKHRTHFVKFKELVFNNNHLSITKRNDIHAGCPGKHSMLPDGRLDGIEACSSFSLAALAAQHDGPRAGDAPTGGTPQARPSLAPIEGDSQHDQEPGTLQLEAPLKLGRPKTVRRAAPEGRPREKGADPRTVRRAAPEG